MSKRTLLTALVCCLALSQAAAFCGFFVAKADKKLFNKTSEVIIARNGQTTVVTMSNDFQGEVEDFAMVIPVPQVLKRNQITIAEQKLFEDLDGYSAPRLAEYHDTHPCHPPMVKMYAPSMRSVPTMSMNGLSKNENLNQKYQVKIEAVYNIEEYKILILSAKNSNGLEAWLTDNDYKIPENAAEVLKPYIRSGMKFFVVKVDAAKYAGKGFKQLRPIQIRYTSDKFMLPIRLGMANAREAQDMLVYCLTPNGRVETANYQTKEIPSNMDIPVFVKEKFGPFYKDVFLKAWEKEGKDDVWLEYAWDISGWIGVKCDPCNGPPPQIAGLKKAGADWLEGINNGQGYTGSCYFTRLHVRYDRAHFPQDLQFIETPNKQRFQGRYVIHNPAQPPFDCETGNYYVQRLKIKRKARLSTLEELTGWDTHAHASYVSAYDKHLDPNQPMLVEPKLEDKDRDLAPVAAPRGPLMPMLMLALVSLALIWFAARRFMLH